MSSTVDPTVAKRYEELDSKPQELTWEMVEAFNKQMIGAHGDGSLEHAHGLALIGRKAMWELSPPASADAVPIAIRGRAAMERAIPIGGTALRAVNAAWWRHILSDICQHQLDGQAASRWATDILDVVARTQWNDTVQCKYKAMHWSRRAWVGDVNECLTQLAPLWSQLTEAHRKTRCKDLRRIAEHRADLDDATKTLLNRAQGTEDGIQKALRSRRPTANYTELRQALADLEALTGLVAVKQQVRRLVAQLRLRQARADAGLPVNNTAQHMAFLGPPGTGKTTVARLLGRIFKALGLLVTDTVVETDRSGLVAEYVGQTAPKVNAIVDKALDGILFVDEAYTLTGSSRQDYGQEAIATLLKRMEDDRDHLVVIFAGYPEQMEALLASNPGLRSRVSNVLRFAAFSSGELHKILLGMSERAGYDFTADADVRAHEICGLLRSGVDERSFGNAREVRNVFEDTLASQALRLAAQMDAGTGADTDKDGTLMPSKEALAKTKRKLSVAQLRTIEADDVTWEELGDPMLDTLDEHQSHLVAVHEAGHALVRHVVNASPPMLVTIVPSSTALGRTFFAERSSDILFRKDLLAMAASALGGRAAEEAVLGAPTAGAIGDLAMAERILFTALRAGLSENASEQALDEFARSGASHGRVEQMSHAARKEVAEMLNEAWQMARQAIEEHRAALDKLSAELVAKRVIQGQALQALLPQI